MAVLLQKQCDNWRKKVFYAAIHCIVVPGAPERVGLALEILWLTSPATMEGPNVQKILWRGTLSEFLLRMCRRFLLIYYEILVNETDLIFSTKICVSGNFRTLQSKRKNVTGPHWPASVEYTVKIPICWMHTSVHLSVENITVFACKPMSGLCTYLIQPPFAVKAIKLEFHSYSVKCQWQNLCINVLTAVFDAA